MNHWESVLRQSVQASDVLVAFGVLVEGREGFRFRTSRNTICSGQTVERKSPTDRARLPFDDERIRAAVPEGRFDLDDLRVVRWWNGRRDRSRPSRPVC